MKNERDPRGPGENWALANGYLIAAAETAEKLAVVIGYVQDMVKKRVNPVGLIGFEMADAIEEFSTEVVSKIRAAVEAKEGRSQGEEFASKPMTR